MRRLFYAQEIPTFVPSLIVSLPRARAARTQIAKRSPGYFIAIVLSLNAPGVYRLPHSALSSRSILDKNNRFQIDDSHPQGGEWHGRSKLFYV